jgi:hypothetical protein
MECVVLEMGISVSVMHAALFSRIEGAQLLHEDGEALCSCKVFISVFQIIECYIPRRRA